ncbi:MAG TPA: hypothetical protein PK468_25695 [Candidatus Hydrogenedentes bacterium]|nr:hypothetical protein [Candidatus Hydrogenedentota bacterium]
MASHLPTQAAGESARELSDEARNPGHDFGPPRARRRSGVWAMALAACMGLFLSSAGMGVVMAAGSEIGFRNLLTSHLMEIPFTQWHASHDIYVVNADGTGLTALTTTPENECYPAWSPDGSQIVFARRKGGHFVISLMNSDGSNMHDLFEPDLSQSADSVECTPVWSPDSSRIAFTSGRDGNLEVYVMDADGSNPRNVTNNPAADGFPSWSPSGSDIAFTSDRDGHMQIYVCDLNGKNVRRLTDDEDDDFAPSWAPDGQQILMTARSAKREYRIEVIDIGKPGAEKTRVGPENTSFASWAPDGRRVALTLPKGNPGRIEILDTETRTSAPVVPSREDLDLAATQVRIDTSSLRSYGGAQWSPDGKKLVFSAMSVRMQSGPPRPGTEWPMRWVYLGAHGELLTPGFYTSPDKDELRIEPLDGGLALVHTGPRWSGTYAVIGPDGKIRIVPPVLAEVDQTSAPEIWPYRDKAGRPIAPPYGAVIAAKHAVSPPGIDPPEGTLGWFFQCADGEFFTPEPEVPIHTNTFWVIRRDDGLQFVRTGPVSKGEVYATVTPDQRVSFAPGLRQGPPLCWGLEDESGQPAFSAHSGKWYPMPCDKVLSPFILHPNGSVTTSLPFTIP